MTQNASQLLPGRRLTLGLLLVAVVGPANAQARPDSVADSAQAPLVAPPSAHAVRFGQDTILLLRGDLGPYAAVDRAAAATERLRVLAQGSLTAADSVWAGVERGLPAVFVGGRSLLFVLSEDAEAGLTPEESAVRVAARIEEGLARAQASRSPVAILAGLGMTILATLALFLFMRLVRGGVRRLRAAAIPELRRRIIDIGIRGFTLLRASQAVRSADLAIEGLRWLGLLVGVYVYLTFVFRQFAATRPWADQLGSASLAFASDAAFGIVGVIPDLAIVLAIVLLTRFLVRLANAFFEAVEQGSVEIEWLHREVARPTKKLVAIGLWIFAIIVMFPYLPGSDTDAFKGVTIFVGLVLSLGSSGLVGNGMSGLVLMYSRALKVGDVIGVGETTGEVVELGMLATRMRTLKNVVVTLPNSVVAGGQIRNFSRLAEVGELVLHTEVTIGYDAPWRTVQQLLTEAALRVSGVLEHPAPFVRQTRLGDFAVGYELNAHIATPIDMPRIRGDLHAAIQDAFNAAGIEIMSPTFEVKRSGPQSTVVPAGGGGTSPQR